MIFQLSKNGAKTLLPLVENKFDCLLDLKKHTYAAFPRNVHCTVRRDVNKSAVV